MGDTHSHTRFKKLLQDAGYENIQEPDKLNNKTKDIDLLVEGLALEVKEMVLSPIEIEQRDKLEEEWRKNHMVSTFKPVKNNTFQHAAYQANKQLSRYVKDYSTMIGLDLLEWGLLEPSIEFILNGVQQLLIDPRKSAIIASRQRGVAARPDVSANVKSVLILSQTGFVLCHLSYSLCKNKIPEEFYSYLKSSGKLTEINK